MKRLYTLVTIFTAAMLTGANGFALDSGLFRTIPVHTPEKGSVWIQNTSFYAPIDINPVLKNTYGVTGSKVFTSMTRASLGITNRIALTGSIPYYADRFSQHGDHGHKTGPGDVAVGLRMSLAPSGGFFRSVTFGGGVCIPEEMGYGTEPLGFRTFSTGEFAYTGELSAGFSIKRVEGYLSASYHDFSNAERPSKAYGADVFYESSYGYLGIGKEDASGKASVIYQNHYIATAGVAYPIRTWFSGIMEVSTASFIGNPKRDTIVRIAPGVRLGNPQRIHVNTGMDFRISGDIPVHTVMMQVTIPFLRPRDLIRRPATKEPVPKELIRSRNSLVAVNNFSKSDIRFLYEKDLKHAFLNELKSMGIMDIVKEERVDASVSRSRLVPGADSHQRLGVRLGANYLINTDIANYSIERGSSFAIPFVVGFPVTTFSLAANASVTDLVTGKTHDLGVISVSVKQSRGVNLFAHGKSSDIVYLTEPERRIKEKELIDRWVERFNEVIIEHIDVFGWEPKRTEIRGDEETKG